MQGGGIQVALELLPMGEVRPTGHAMQDASALCWVSVPYLPSTQFVQFDDPVTAAYFPNGQAVHTDLPTVGPYRPTAHNSQTKNDVAPWRPQDVPTGQSIQSDNTLTVVVAYFPAGHLLQFELDEDDVPLVSVYFPAPHSTQADSFVAPTRIPYFPWTHAVQLTEPVVFLYVPATHAEQTPPSGPV